MGIKDLFTDFRNSSRNYAEYNTEKAFFKDCLNRVAIGTTEYARKEQKEADKRKAARQARKANQQQMDFNKVISKVQPEIELIREKEELIKELQKDIAGHAFNISINKYDMNDVQLLSHYSACLKNTLDIINSMIERIENHFKKNAPKEWGLIWCRTLNNFTLSPYTNLPFSIMAKI